MVFNVVFERRMVHTIGEMRRNKREFVVEAPQRSTVCGIGELAWVIIHGN